MGFGEDVAPNPPQGCREPRAVQEAAGAPLLGLGSSDCSRASPSWGRISCKPGKRHLQPHSHKSSLQRDENSGGLRKSPPITSSIPAPHQKLSLAPARRCLLHPLLPWAGARGFLPAFWLFEL